MNVTINSNAFTKMDKMVGLSIVEIKVLDYYLQNRILKGNVKQGDNVVVGYKDKKIHFNVK